MFRIDRCICTNLSIEQLVTLARREGYTHEQLIAATTAGDHCGLCRPYVRCALKTGQTVFHQILVEPPDRDETAA